MNARAIIEQREALVRLLGDDDPTTLALVKSQLASGGLQALPELKALLTATKGAPAHHLGEVVAVIEEQEADALFAQVCSEFGEHGDLEDAVWRVAATFLPGDDFAEPRALLDEWGREVARRLIKAESPLDRAETLSEFLSHDIGLRGNEDDYYNINNSLLPEVIESRCGIPITLSLIHMLVGRRAGLSVHGIGLPGHFLVRHADVFFDPFHGGRRVGLDECRELLQRQNLVLTPQHLAPATPRQILIRILTNIYYVAEQSDPPLAAKVGGWIEALRG